MPRPKLAVSPATAKALEHVVRTQAPTLYTLGSSMYPKAKAFTIQRIDVKVDNPSAFHGYKMVMRLEKLGYVTYNKRTKAMTLTEHGAWTWLAHLAP